MQSYNCLIVDDEPPAREILKRYIDKMPMLKLLGQCGNAFEAMAVLHQQQVDLLFLDIQMPQLNGLEFLGSLTKAPKVIFTTAFADYALQSYDLDAVDYLLKPIKFERFVKAINKAIPKKETEPADRAIVEQAQKSFTEPEAFLYFRSERKMVKVLLKDILYVESLKDYVKIATTHGLIITKYSMSAMEAMLPSTSFLRVHRSFMVALGQVRSYSATHLQLTTVEIPVGKLYQREVLKRLNDAQAGAAYK